jgi:protein FAM98B
LEVDDTNTLEVSSLLQSIALMLDINPRQPSGVTVAAEIQKQVEKLRSLLPSGFFNAIVPSGTLSDTQVSMLKEVDTALHAENALRRRMLIERVKVTLQSFMWSTRLTEESDLKTTAEATITTSLAGMDATPRVSVEDVFTATLGDVMTVTERATSASGPGAMRAKVKDVLIGSVPDRGGRTDGKRKVAMPVWSERKVTPGGGGRGRGRGRGGGGAGGRGGGGPNKKQKT